MNPFHLMGAQAQSPGEQGATEFLANLSLGTVLLAAAVLTALRLYLLYATAVAPRPGTKPETPGWARGIADIFESLIVAGVLVFLIIRPFFVQAFFIPSSSMENTLLGHDEGNGYSDTVHDHIFVNKLAYRFGKLHHGDIIVFRAPKDADKESEYRGLTPHENILIKRLMGLPGDTMEVKDGAVYRNGQKLIEPYIKEPINMHQAPEAVFAVDKPLTLPPHMLFVMGDNRNNSNDSRYWGLLEDNRVIGRAALIFWPLNRIRALN